MNIVYTILRLLLLFGLSGFVIFLVLFGSTLNAAEDQNLRASIYNYRFMQAFESVDSLTDAFVSETMNQYEATTDVAIKVTAKTLRGDELAVAYYNREQFLDYIDFTKVQQSPYKQVDMTRLVFDSNDEVLLEFTYVFDIQ